MSSFVKKLMATGAALSIGISGFAIANDYYVPSNGSHNVSYNNGYNGYNGGCCPPVCDPCCGNWLDNLSFNAAWLYWKASGDDFQYAVEKVRNVPGTGVTQFTSYEKYHDVSFDWDSGFRIAFGLNLPNVCWDLCVDWTHYDTSSSSKTAVFGDGTPPRSVSAGFPVAVDFVTDTLGEGQSVFFRASTKLRYNTVDIAMGKWCCCGEGGLMFRPHVGFRLADIQERFRDAVDGNGAVTFDDTYAAAAFRHQNRFKGVGVRIGLDTDLHLCDGWSFIGRGAASAIWGTTHLRNVLVTSTTGVADSDTDYSREDFHQTRFITDLSLGVRWKTMACGCYPVTLELAWEHHYLFNQHRYWVVSNYASPTASSGWRSTGDMALQGLTLTAGFDF